MAIFHCYVSSPEGIGFEAVYLFERRPWGIHGISEKRSLESFNAT